MDKFSPVKPGDKLRIPANAYNAFVAAARDYESRAKGNGADLSAAGRGTTIVPIKNNSGANRARFEVLGISGVLTTPTTNADAFKSRVMLTGVTPVIADHTGAFAVLLEPIPDGKIGLAVISGAVQVKVEVTAATDGYADVKASAAELKTGTSGAARILWKESGTGTGKWAVVRIGAGGGGAGTPEVRFGKADEAIDYDAEATVSVWSSEPEADSTTNVEAENWLGPPITTGERVWLFDTNSQTYCLGFGLLRLAKADAAIALGSSGTVSVWEVSGGTEADSTANVTAYNWIAQKVRTDDRLVIGWHAQSQRWYIVQVFKKARFIRFTLGGALDTSTASVASCTVTLFWDGRDPGGTVTVYNLAAHSGYVFAGDSGDAGLAVYDEDNDYYRIIQMECP